MSHYSVTLATEIKQVFGLKKVILRSNCLLHVGMGGYGWEDIRYQHQPTKKKKGASQVVSCFCGFLMMSFLTPPHGRRHTTHQLSVWCPHLQMWELGWSTKVSQKCKENNPGVRGPGTTGSVHPVHTACDTVCVTVLGVCFGWCRTVRSLGVLNGKLLLGMTRDEMRTVCPEEGSKVFFQLQAIKSAIAVSNAP